MNDKYFRRHRRSLVIAPVIGLVHSPMVESGKLQQRKFDFDDVSGHNRAQ
jgi:hypothetical protein